MKNMVGGEDKGLERKKIEAGTARDERRIARDGEGMHYFDSWDAWPGYNGMDLEVHWGLG